MEFLSAGLVATLSILSQDRELLHHTYDPLILDLGIHLVQVYTVGEVLAVVVVSVPVDSRPSHLLLVDLFAKDRRSGPQ